MRQATQLKTLVMRQVEGVGDAAADVAEGVSDAVGGNDANNNGK